MPPKTPKTPRETCLARNSYRPPSSIWPTFHHRGTNENQSDPTTINVNSDGQIDPERIRYLARDGIPEVPSPLHYDSKIYFVKNGGILTCIDYKTAEHLSRMRTGERGTHYASPIIQGDLQFSSAGDGTTSVIRLADKPKVIATNQLESPVIAASAIVEGVLYIRTRDKICAFKVAGQ